MIVAAGAPPAAVVLGVTALLLHDLGATGKDFFVLWVVEVEDRDELETLNDFDLDDLLVGVEVVGRFCCLERAEAMEGLR